MKIANLPPDEKERLETVRALKILDSGAEERYDRITRLAQRLFDVPIAAFTIIDENRQWFKSKQGLDGTETSRDVAFCAHTILQNNSMVVPDTLQDDRFQDNPLVTAAPNIRFYAGHPVHAPNMNKIGSLCIIDKKPRLMSQTELKLLEGLTKLAEQEIARQNLPPDEDIQHHSEKLFFQTLLKYVMNFAKVMKVPTGVMVVRVPAKFDGKNIAKPIHRDRMMIEVAKILDNSVRTTDVVGALDSDAFYILFPKCNESGLKIVLDRIQKNSSVLQTKLNCSPNYALITRKFLWNPTDPETVDELVQKGKDLLQQTH